MPTEAEHRMLPRPVQEWEVTQLTPRAARRFPPAISTRLCPLWRRQHKRLCWPPVRVAI